MKRMITALVTAATLTTAGVSGASAMSMEHNMLTGAVYNELTRLGISTDGMMDLTLGQVGQLGGLLLKVLP